MNIVLYSLIFAPDVCSNAYVFSDLAKGLQKLGHNVSVITTTPHYDEASALQRRESLMPGKKHWYLKSNFNGMNVYHVVVAPKKGGTVQRLRSFFRFHHYGKKVLKEEPITADVVLTQTPPFTVGITAQRLAKRLGAKSVMVVQDLFVDALVTKGKVKGPLKLLMEAVEKFTYRSVDALSTISDDMEMRLREKTEKEKTIAVIPNFVDPEVFHPITEDYRAEFGLAKDDFVISYVGNIGNAQDLMPLIALARKQKNVKILIAGNGAQEQKYRQITSAEHLENIRFLGYVSREDALKINSVSDVCMIMLAKHVMATSFPSKTYSLMAMGKPIVITCSEQSQAGQFIQSNRIGFHVNVEDPDAYVALIEQLRRDKSVLENCGSRALELIRTQYNSETVSGQYAAFTQRIRTGEQSGN